MDFGDQPLTSLTKPELVVLLYNFGDRLAAVEKALAGVQSSEAALRVRNAELSARVVELEARLKKDSHNSGKPPSSDGYGKKPSPKSLRQKGERPSGGQPGHPGRTLEMSASPTRTVLLDLPACCGCGADLRSVAPDGRDSRQVFDLPPLVLESVQYDAERKRCPCCGLAQSAAFPSDVAQPAQYGPGIKALALYLSAHQLLPSDRTAGMLSDLFGCTFSEGTLDSALRRAGQVLEPVAAAVKDGVARSAVVHFDESGVRVEGSLHWLHVACTESLTHYEVCKRRGRAALEQIGMLPGFDGTAVHDGFESYWSFGCPHGLCNAHHLRELTFLEEQYKQEWAAAMKRLLLRIKKSVDAAKARQAAGLSLLLRYVYEEEYGSLVEEGYRQNPRAERQGKGRPKQSKGHNLVWRLDRGKREALAFMNDFSIPFDNNQAERDIRMIKVRQKISGCFRTQEGAKIFSRIRGYVSTMRKQGHNALEVLMSVASGKPTAPLVPAPT